jgi:outer membrane protein, heavy metal efflux system
MTFKRIFFILIIILSVKGNGLAGPEETPGSGQNDYTPALTGEITLIDALNAAFSSEPDLAAYAIEVEKNQFLEEQAGIFPNPSFFMGMEEFGGSGTHAGTQVMGSRYGISQELELGGKRKKRRQAAKQRTAVARYELEEKRRDLETVVKSRFVNVYTSQQTLDTQQENFELVRNSYSIIAELVKAGEVSPLLENKAAVEVAAAENTLLQAEQAFRKARLELAATWNSFNPEFTAVKGDFKKISEIPPMNSVFRYLDEHPRAGRWAAVKSQSQAELTLEKSRIWPNVEIGGGVQKLRVNNEHAYYVELNIPIPLFDRNQGEIKAALAETRIAEKREQYTLLMLKNQAAGIFRDITAVRAELIAINKTLIPAARKSFDAVSEAFRMGEEEYLSVIDAQRQLLESTRRQAELTSRFFGLKAELEGLTGTPLENII